MLTTTKPQIPITRQRVCGVPRHRSGAGKTGFPPAIAMEGWLKVPQLGSIFLLEFLSGSMLDGCVLFRAPPFGWF